MVRTDGDAGQSRPAPDDDLLADGGGASESIPITDSLMYARNLKDLAALERRSASGTDDVDPARVGSTVDSFLSSPYVGGAHRSGLRIATRLTLRFDIGQAQVREFSVTREPEASVVRWALAAHGSQHATLPAEAFDFCIDRSQWQRVLVEAVERQGSSVRLTDEQLGTLADTIDASEEVRAFLNPLRERGLESEARTLLERYFDGSVDESEPVRLLRAADELGLDGPFRERLATSLRRWRPDDGTAELERLVEFGRREGLNDEVLTAVERWLLATDADPVPREHRSLVAAAVEALIERSGPGTREAITLYRRHLYGSDSVFGIESDLLDVAESVGDDDVASDVLAAADPELEDEIRDVREAELAAKVAEREERWDDAYDVWRRILETAPTQSRFERAIENRLRIRRLDAAMEQTDRFESFSEDPVRTTAYRIRIAAARGDHRQVVGLVSETEGLFELPDRYAEPVAEAYIRALADLGRWEELESSIEDTGRIEKTLERFYLRVAQLMRFVNDAPDAIDGSTAVDVAERLLTTPMSTGRLRLVINLGIVGNLADEIRASSPGATDRLDVVEGLLEILVSLHAERLIDALEAEGIATDEYEEMLADVDLRRGGRQLLSELDREAQRQGIVTTHGYD